ncbi:MAG: helix-turn-helix domain-containing protein [Oscillospiraceae bacterium]
MSFGEQLRKRREELGISRAELAGRLGISRSAVGNYETGVSAPKEEVLLRLFDALGVDPNYLYRDAYRAGGGIRSDEEQALLEGYRRLSLAGRADGPHHGPGPGGPAAGVGAPSAPAGLPHHPPVCQSRRCRICRPGVQRGL